MTRKSNAKIETKNITFYRVFEIKWKLKHFHQRRNSKEKRETTKRTNKLQKNKNMRNIHKKQPKQGTKGKRKNNKKGEY